MSFVSTVYTLQQEQHRASLRFSPLAAAALWFLSLFSAFTATLRYLSLFMLRLYTVLSSASAYRQHHKGGKKLTIQTVVCQWFSHLVERTEPVHLLKGIINIGCCFEELLCEHVHVTLSDIMRHFVFGCLIQLLHFTLSWRWLKKN